MLSNLVCNHTCEKQIRLQLCCRQILLSLVWLETELYWTPVSPITITNAVIRFWSHPFWNDWCSWHSDVRQTLSLSYAWRKCISWRCFSLSLGVIIKFFPLILKSINLLLIFYYPFSCSFSHILVFILIICNPPILQNRLQQLLNSLSFRAIKTSHSEPSGCLFLLGVMDSTFTCLYPFLHSTMDLSCPDQTSLPATFLFYHKKSQVPKPLPQDKFW